MAFFQVGYMYESEDDDDFEVGYEDVDFDELNDYYTFKKSSSSSGESEGEYHQSHLDYALSLNSEEDCESDAISRTPLGFQGILSQDILCDVTIKIGSEEFQAHKNILAASSDYFMSMFTSGFQEAGSSTITIEGDSKIFRLLLEFIYTGKMNGLTIENITDVLSMTCYLCLTPHALQECKRFIDRHLSGAKHWRMHYIDTMQYMPLHVAYILSLRPEPELADVVNAVNRYIYGAFLRCGKEPEFLEHGTKECLDTCLEMTKTHPKARQPEIFDIAIKWLQYCWDDRKHHTCDVLNRLQLESVNSDTLKAFMEEASGEVPECKELLQRVLKNKSFMAHEAEELLIYGNRGASYMEHVCSGLKEFQSRNTLCDITIRVGSKEFQAHKNILAARSDYFKMLFLESNNSEVNIAGNNEIFELLFEFIYTEEITGMSMHNIMAILKMACFLQLPGVLAKGTSFLRDQMHDMSISLQMAYEISLLKDSNLTTLVKLATLYVEFHFTALSSEPDFLEQTSAECLQMCLDKSSKRFKKRKEEEMLEVTCKWLKYDWEGRKQNAYELLKKLRLGLILSSTLKELMDDEIQKITECKHLLEEVMQLKNRQPTSPLAVASVHISHPQWFAPSKSKTAFLLVGGIELDRNQNKYLDKYNKWRKQHCVRALPGIIRDHSTVVVNGHLCLAGGMVKRQNQHRSHHHRDKHVWDIHPGRFCWYDIIEHEWKPLAPMITARRSFALVQMGEFVYAIGGKDEDGLLSDVERYSISNNQWQKVSELPIPCKDPSAVVYNKKILVYGLKAGSLTNYVLQIFTPHDAGMEDGLGGSWYVALDNQKHAKRKHEMIPKYVLVVHKAEVYRIVYEDTNELGLKKWVSVSQLIIDCKSPTPHTKIGPNEDQSTLLKYAKLTYNYDNIFCIIKGELYANFLGCAQKIMTEAQLTDLSMQKELSHVASRWSWKIGLKDNGGSVIMFTYDKTAKIARQTFAEEELPDWM